MAHPSIGIGKAALLVIFLQCKLGSKQGGPTTKQLQAEAGKVFMVPEWLGSYIQLYVTDQKISEEMAAAVPQLLIVGSKRHEAYYGVGGFINLPWHGVGLRQRPRKGETSCSQFAGTKASI